MASDRLAGLEFREPNEADHPSMLTLLRRTFGETWPGVDRAPSAAEYLRWKTSSAVGRGLEHNGSVVALDGDRVVSLLIGVPRRIKVGPRVMTSVDSVDVCVDPDYQGRGIYSEMERQTTPVYEQFDFQLYSPGNAHPAFTRASRIRSRIMIPFDGVVQHFLVFDPLRLARRRTEDGRLDARTLALAGALAGIGLGAWLAALARRHRGPRPRVRQVERFPSGPAGVDGVWEAACSQFDVIVERRAEHLNWRYADPRGGRFTIYLAEDALEVNGRPEGVTGYLVARYRPDRADVADVLVMPGRDDALRALLERAIADARRSGLPDALGCWLPRGHAYSSVLRRLGFVDLRRRRQFNYSPIREGVTGLEPMTDPRSRMHFTQGDSDLI